MTPKEALKAKVRRAHKVYTNEDGVQMCEMEFRKYLVMEQALTELEELKRYPTADEVCRELERYVPHEVTYDSTRCSFNSYSNFGMAFTICQYHENTTISWNYTIKLRLKTMSLIIRFYEGVEKVGNEE